MGLDPFENFNTYIREAFVSFCFVTTHWHVDRLIMLFYRKKYPDNRDHSKRILHQAVTILIFLVLFCTVSNYFLCKLIAEYTAMSPPSLLQLLLSGMIITIAVLGIYETILALQLWKKDAIQTEQLKKENYQAQLEALKNQVNPHFLFNSLNTLTATIQDDPELSIRFVQNLSRVYRYVLDTKNKELVLLEEELEAIEPYIFLLETRFGKKINFSFDIKTTDKKKYIIPLSLQMLIENAIKHNVLSSESPLQVSITTDNDYLIVENNMQIKEHTTPSTKMGLNNIKKRYQLLNDRQLVVISDSEYFKVQLPLMEIMSYANTDY